MKNRIQGTGFRIQDGKLTSLLHVQHEGRRAESRILNPGYSKGFSLVSAIFLLVVIAALGTFAVTLSTNQQQSAALDILGARAYQAARAGIEWGAYQAISNPAAINCPVGAAASNPVDIPAALDTMAIFTVDVSCRGYAPVSEAANTITLYQLTSTATQGAVATPNYVERQMQATIAR